MRWIAALLVALALPSVADAASCPATAPGDAFTADRMKTLSERYVRDGLYRVAGTEAHEKSVAWLEDELASTPGMTVSETRRSIPTWAPKNGRLETAGRTFVRDNGTWRTLPSAGAVPLSLPTGRDGIGGKLALIGPDDAITEANAKGRVVVIDAPYGGIPYAGFAALSWYLTPDLASSLAGTFTRPYFGTDLPLGQRLVAAGKAGASGVIVAFDVPREQVAGYFDPHTGVNFTTPAVFTGVDEREELHRLAAAGADARVAVRATRGTAQSPTLDATLPGAQGHRVVLQSHTDGVTWIQDNGPVAILALTKWFASLPQDCRPSVEVLLTSGHLVQSEGNNSVEPEAERIDKEFDEGKVGAVITLEHLGSRAIEPSPRDGAPGNQLDYTGASEPAAISVSESPLLVDAVVGAVQRRGIDRVAVLRNAAVPSAGTVPPNCSPGGDNTAFWQRIVPAVQAISGPWSLFAPSFGEDAVDFDRMATQAAIFADTVLEVAPQDPQLLAGNLMAYRAARAGGAKTCSDFQEDDIRNAFEPRDQAPGPGADALRLTTARATRRLRLSRRPRVTCSAAGGGAPRTCTARVLAGRRVVARGYPRLKPTRRGRSLRRVRRARIVIAARDAFDVRVRKTIKVRVSR